MNTRDLTNPDNYLEGTYSGRDIHLAMIIRAVTDYQKHSPEATRLVFEERQALRRIYLQLIWCDRISIHFHKQAVELAKTP